MQDHLRITFFEGKYTMIYFLKNFKNRKRAYMSAMDLTSTPKSVVFGSNLQNLRNNYFELRKEYPGRFWCLLMHLRSKTRFSELCNKIGTMIPGLRFCDSAIRDSFQRRFVSPRCFQGSGNILEVLRDATSAHQCGLCN